MDIQEFNRYILQKKKQLEVLMRSKMPVFAGNIAKRHIEEDFRKGASHTTDSTDGRKPNGSKAVEATPMPSMDHYSREVPYWQEASNMYPETELSPYSLVSLMPAFTTGAALCILLLLSRCGNSLGHSITENRAETKRKTLSGNASP